MPKNVVVYGDSVTWGQGHKDENKFATKVAAARGATLKMIAHSGATIGRGDPQTGGCGPEAPDHYPTILEQLTGADDDPDLADVVIVDGGINDVSVGTILSPFTTDKFLTNLTRRFCYSDMLFLLQQMVARYQSAATKIVVTSYFPIFSVQSNFEDVLTHLWAVGVAPPPVVQTDLERQAFALRSVELALLFWRESRADLQAAVNDIASSRVIFADVPFTEANAMFTEHPWLFNVHLEDGQLVPEDDVVGTRHEQCVKCHPNQPWAISACDIASAGHPNRPGADQFAAAILAAVG